MIDYQFQWDSRKAKLNAGKHKVTFDEAWTAFYDELAYKFFDRDHSEHEDRYILLGMSRRLRVLVVSFCHRHSDTVIRLISARKADSLESQTYWRRGKQL